MQEALALPSELTIYTVNELHPRCLSWLDANTGDVDEPAVLRLEAQGVTDVDAAGVQLLLALANSLQIRHRQLRLEAPSQALSNACHSLGAACLLSSLDAKESVS